MHGTMNLKLTLRDISLDVHQGLVLRPRCVPEKVGVHEKCVNQKTIFPSQIRRYRRQLPEVRYNEDERARIK
jgi:hypothetical protein